VQAIDRLHGRRRILERSVRVRALCDIDEQTNAIGDVLVERRFQLQDERVVQMPAPTSTQRKGTNQRLDRRWMNSRHRAISRAASDQEELVGWTEMSARAARPARVGTPPRPGSAR
jgi:hypothetical protein